MSKHDKVREAGISSYELIQLAIKHAPFNFWERETVLSFSRGVREVGKKTKIVNRLLHEGVLREEERFSGYDYIFHQAITRTFIVLNTDFSTWGKYSVLRETMYHEFTNSRCWCGLHTGTTHYKDDHKDHHCKSGCDCVAFVPQTRPHDVWLRAQEPQEPPKKRVHKERGRLPAYGRR